MHLKSSSAKWRPYYLGLNVLIKTAIPGITIPITYLYDRDSYAGIIRWNHCNYWNVPQLDSLYIRSVMLHLGYFAKRLKKQLHQKLDWLVNGDILA